MFYYTPYTYSLIILQLNTRNPLLSCWYPITAGKGTHGRATSLCIRRQRPKPVAECLRPWWKAFKLLFISVPHPWWKAFKLLFISVPHPWFCPDCSTICILNMLLLNIIQGNTLPSLRDQS